MIIDKSNIKRILVITLSNVGDIILTTPVIATLAKEFPSSRIDVMSGPKGREIFERDPRISKFIIYDKHMPIAEKRRLQLKLKALRYDLVVDLRNTLFGLLLGPKFRTSTIQHFPSTIIHSIDRHLYRLKSLGIENSEGHSYIHIPKEDEEYVSGLLRDAQIGEPIVIVNPGARSHLKRWTAEGFAEVSDRLIQECGVNIVFIGLKEDRYVVDEVIGKMKNKSFNLVGRINIRQLASLLKRSRLLITNDSAPLHLGCAVGVKVLALFGPTDPKRYGPRGEFDVFLNSHLSCAPCESATCAHNYECMKLISLDVVFNTAKMMLEGYE